MNESEIRKLVLGTSAQAFLRSAPDYVTHMQVSDEYIPFSDIVGVDENIIYLKSGYNCGKEK